MAQSTASSSPVVSPGRSQFGTPPEHGRTGQFFSPLRASPPEVASHIQDVLEDHWAGSSGSSSGSSRASWIPSLRPSGTRHRPGEQRRPPAAVLQPVAERERMPERVSASRPGRSFAPSPPVGGGGPPRRLGDVSQDEGHRLEQLAKSRQVVRETLQSRGTGSVVDPRVVVAVEQLRRAGFSEEELDESMQSLVAQVLSVPGAAQQPPTISSGYSGSSVNPQALALIGMAGAMGAAEAQSHELSSSESSSEEERDRPQHREMSEVGGDPGVTFPAESVEPSVVSSPPVCERGYDAVTCDQFEEAVRGDKWIGGVEVEGGDIAPRAVQVILMDGLDRVLMGVSAKIQQKGWLTFPTSSHYTRWDRGDELKAVVDVVEDLCGLTLPPHEFSLVQREGVLVTYAARLNCLPRAGKPARKEFSRNPDWQGRYIMFVDVESIESSLAKVA